jgi:TolB-like protein/DNA-binding winged helix-turn-helix (wHTH) protein/tetratricopeptide (TPR) repeat protein
MTNEKIRFGPFELDPKAGELRRGGRRVRLQEKPLKVLEALLTQPGEVVTREELRRQLWPANMFVDFDNGLNNAVNKLRTVLADSASDPKYIETVGRRGYRFIGAVAEQEPKAALSANVAQRAPAGVARTDTEPTERTGVDSAQPLPVPTPPLPAALGPVDSPAPSARWATRSSRFRLAVAGGLVAVVAAIIAALLAGRGDPSGTEPRIDSLAVLPLENLSSDPEQEYVSDGMTDALISQLASIRSLRVISRQSVMRYKDNATPMPEIARELGVTGVIEGTVQKTADRVRISIQLIHAPGDRHLWAAEYSRPLDDVIALQSEIARNVVREVAATVTPEESQRLAQIDPVDPEAYDLYLRGRYFWGKRSEEALHRALDYFEHAIAIQPDFARAYAAIAETYGPLGSSGYMHPAEASPKMRAAAERALELDPDLVEGLTALGACASFHEWNWAEGERHFLRAIEVNPNYPTAHAWYGQWFQAQGRHAEDLREKQRAFELDPLSVFAAGLARALDYNGRTPEAIRLLERRLEVDPDNPQFLWNLADFYTASGRYDEAIDAARRAGELGRLGYIYAIAGHREEAVAVRAELERLAAVRYVAPQDFALVEIGLGNTSRALDALEQGFEIRDPEMSWIKVSPAFGPLSDEPRFIALLEKMGLR